MNKFPELTGAILAGGTGRRVGGQDKGWLAYQGRPLVQHVLEAVKPQVNRVALNANQNIPAYEALGFPVIADVKPNLGPLGGIMSLLNAITTDYALVTAVDVPNLPSDLVQQLWSSELKNAAQQQNPAKLILSEDQSGIQPLVGIYHRSLSTSIEDYLAGGQRKLLTWCQSQTPVVVRLTQPNLLKNLNRPEHFLTD